MAVPLDQPRVARRDSTLRHPVGQMWDEADLVRRLRGALETSGRAVAALSTNGYSDPAEPSQNFGPEKVVAETALLLLASNAVKHHPGIQEGIDAVSKLLAPVARGERARAGLVLHPALARDFAFAHACLVRLGNSDQAFDRLLARASSAGPASSRERLPYRDLEQEWLRRVHDPRPEAAARDDRHLPARSMLGRTLDALGSTRDDIYALTHAVMYHTDLGMRRPRLPRPIGAIIADAETALAWALDEQDYDLGGEVLLAWPMLGQRWGASAAFGFRVLTQVEDEAGFLPTPATRVERYLTLAGDDRPRYILATAYHTVYVMGLLCAAALRPGCAPPSNIPRGRSPRGSGEALIGALEETGSDAHWRSVFFALAPGERDSVAPVLLTMLLRRAFSRHDLRAMHTALDLGSRFGLLDAPVSKQAAEVLQRALLLGDVQRS